MLALAVLVPVVSTAALPWGLSTSAGRAWLLARAGRTLAPGRLELASLRFSWFGPTRMTGFVLLDKSGDKVVDAPRAVWDRTFAQILFERPKLGTLTLDRGVIDAERDEDGVVDLYETIKPVLGGDPRLALRIVVVDGRLRVRVAGIEEPLTAEHADLTLDFVPRPEPLRWNLRLANGPAKGETLAIRGSFNQWESRAGKPAALRIDLDGGDWPWSIRNHTVAASGRFSGRVTAGRRDGLWEFGGVTTMKSLEGSLPSVSADQLRLERLDAAWNIAQNSDGGWTVPRLEVSTPLITVNASAETKEGRFEGRGRIASKEHGASLDGTIAARSNEAGVAIERLDVAVVPGDLAKSQEPLRFSARGSYDRAWDELLLEPIVGQEKRPAPAALELRRLAILPHHDWSKLVVEAELGGDVGALGDWLPESMDGLRGSWSARASASSRDDKFQLSGAVDAESRSIGATGNIEVERLLGVKLEASAPRDLARIDLETLALSSRYASLTASGRLDDPRGRRVAEVTGSFAPDWKSISAMLSARVEPGASVKGHPSPMRLRAQLTEDWRKTLEGEFGIGLDGADVYGLKLGPTPLVVRAREGRLVFDPIDATLNGGRVHVEPVISLEGADGPAIRLGPETSVADIQVNDEVSHRVLSFVAPVLDNATRVSGRVSAEIEDAYFPLSRDGKRGMTVNGQVEFQDVAFNPGPLAEQLLDVVRVTDRPSWRLNKPVSLSIADRRVHQTGLALPLGRLSQIELEGWVDFDRNMELTASIPFTPAMVANRPVLGGIVGGTRVSVPIHGTLDNPKVDKEALGVAMKEMGVTLLEQTVTRGLPELLMKLTRPPDPNAPPPPPRLTPAERRAQRREKQAERRRERGQGP